MKITVLLPTYNRRRFLPAALACLKRQTFADWNLFVLNDGGEDVADLVAACEDARMVYFDRPHLGKAAQLNFALARVTSKYVAYMDDDDEVFPEHLQRLHDAAERLQSDFVYSDTWQTVLDHAGRCLSRTVENDRDVTFEDIRLYNRINHKQILHTLDLSRRVGPYDESLRILIDFDYIRRLMRAAVNPFHLREITGDHFLREADPAQGASAITGLWQRDPEAAGRSVLAVFAKDPAALAQLYKLPGRKDVRIAWLEERLSQRLSARWRAWRHRHDPEPVVPVDALPPDAAWTASPVPLTEAALARADESHPTLAAVNRIAAGGSAPEDAQRVRAPLTEAPAAPCCAFAVTADADGLRFARADAKPMRWIALTSPRALPPDFAVSFDYTPHAACREQLQLDFAMTSFGDRLRFMVRDNNRLVFSRVERGCFRPDDRVLPFSFALGQRVRIRLQSCGGVHTFSVDGRALMSLKFGSGVGGYLSLISYQDVPEGAVDFTLAGLRLEVPKCASAS